MKPITLDTLREFCSTDASRFVLTNPFAFCGHTYATDGCIMVRALSDLVPCENTDRPKMQSIVEDFTHDRIQEWKPLPDLGPVNCEKVKCKECDGHGFIEECRRCKGDGSGFCSCCGRLGDCEECHGEGRFLRDSEGAGAKPCENCKGQKVVDGVERISLGGVTVNGAYLRKLQARFDNVEFPAVSVPGCPIPFRFHGGEGLLMPLIDRPKSTASTASTASTNVHAVH